MVTTFWIRLIVTLKDTSDSFRPLFDSTFILGIWNLFLKIDSLSHFRNPSPNSHIPNLTSSYFRFVSPIQNYATNWRQPAVRDRPMKERQVSSRKFVKLPIAPKTLGISYRPFVYTEGRHKPCGHGTSWIPYPAACIARQRQRLFDKKPSSFLAV